MSVQISTRIDDETKRRFDNVCESIGISPSNARKSIFKNPPNNAIMRHGRDHKNQGIF